MTLTRIKLIVAVVALAVLTAGIRLDLPQLRWVAIGLLALAFLLRFLPKSSSGSNS